NSSDRILGHHPLGHPERALRLLLRLAVAHWDVDRLAVVREVHDELRRSIALARCRIDRRHAETDWLTALELAAGRAGARLAQAKEVHHVSVDDQTIVAGGLSGHKRRGQQGGQNEKNSERGIPV